MKLLTFLPIMLLICCTKDFNSETKIKSPSGKYFLTSSVNRTDRTKSDYLEVVINVYNSNSLLIAKYGTGASDNSKWAIDWANNQDIILLYSSDIGTKALKIQNNTLELAQLNNNLIDQANIIKTKKYKL